jgi:tRNA-specific 2-thiouridylase
MPAARFEDALDRLTQRSPGARVLVGMSGGVDSSVAAALLHERGLEVIGVSLHLWEPPLGSPEPSRCCAPEDLADARASAAALGIPYFVFDRQREFDAGVISPFVDAYLAGTTPSPCVACNRDVKIAAFVALCRQLGAAAFATGHYARAGVVHEGLGADGAPAATRLALLRGEDRKKDQSYFLHGIGAEALSLLVTPLGAMTKPRVREEAARLGLPNASKPDSEDLCFSSGDHAAFVESRAEGRVRPGAIVDAEGRVVGAHAGVHRFTIGQRKKLGIALGKPAYVASIDAETATVHLAESSSGDAPDALHSKGAIVRDVAWLATRPRHPRAVIARVRYRHDGAPAEITPLDDDARRVRVRFETNARAITPGQACVFYDGDEVLGGGTIEAATAT